MIDAAVVEQQIPQTPEASASKPPKPPEVEKPIGREELKMAQEIRKDTEGPDPDPDKALREIAGEKPQGSTTETIVQETSPEIARTEDIQIHLKSYTESLITQLVEDQVKSGLDRNAAETEVRSRVEKARGYFEKVDVDRGITPTERISQMYDLIDVPEGETGEFSAAIAEHSHELIERAFDQHFENPEQYVSHGFDHSLNVADYTRSIIEQNPQILSSMMEKYGISEGQARFMLENVAMFHDAGYPELEGRAKAVHAIEGAEIVSTPKMQELYRKMLPNIPPEKQDELLYDFRDSIMHHNADTVQRSFQARIITTKGDFLIDNKNIITVMSVFNPDMKDPVRGATSIYVQDEATRQQLLAEMLRVTGEHAGDSEEFPIQVVREGQKLRGRVIDLAEKGDSLLGLEFKKVDTSSSPMHAVVRLADNMDMRTNRFTEIQREDAFMEVYEAFGDNGEVSQKLHTLEDLGDLKLDEAPLETRTAVRDQSSKLLTEGLTEEELGLYQTEIEEISVASQARDLWKKVVVERSIKKHPDLDPKRAEDIRRIAMSQNSESMRHFGGCEAIQGLELTGSSLTISVDRSLFDKLNGTQVVEKSLDENGDVTRVSVGVGEYQIWRLRQAYESISVDGQKIQVRILDENGEEIPGKEEVPSF